MPESPDPGVEAQIDQWRAYVRRRQAIKPVDVAELEDHLREQLAGLVDAGLAPDEAFLVAVKRLGNLDELSREFAREHSDRLWKQLVVAPGSADAPAATRRDALVAFGFAVAAAVTVKVPGWLGLDMDAHEVGYVRNASFFALPFLAGYFAWKRALGAHVIRNLAGVFLAALALANLPGLGAAPGFGPLTALHLPIALWLGVGIAYTGGRWNEPAARMDFVRFTGELFIYFVLIALGGGVLCGFLALTFSSIGVNIGPILGTWILPCGAAGAVIIASWLVEAKQSVIENMAPVLTRLFTPLFAAMLLAFLGAVAFSGRGVAIDRDLLIGFDLLLVVVVGLVVYAISARDPEAKPGWFDRLQAVLIVSALLADLVALTAIGARIGEFGFSPNRVAALGENLILLVNLGGAAVLSFRFLRGRSSFQQLERWQTGFLPVYAAWAALVVWGFPLLFRWLG